MKKEPDYRKLTSPCGIDCFNCELHAANVTQEMQQRVGKMMGLEPQRVTCNGCRVSGCFFIPDGCGTKSCVEENGVSFCYECREFPCIRLHPALDRADRLPHNMKLYNLCRIRNVGLERWARDESREIRRRYREGVMEIGNGPQFR